MHHTSILILSCSDLVYKTMQLVAIWSWRMDYRYMLNEIAGTAKYSSTIQLMNEV